MWVYFNLLLTKYLNKGSYFLVMFVLMCTVAAVLLIEEGPVYWHAVFSRGYRSEHDD